ncbi:hypothetical protein [Okeania sp. SIO2B3]|uniref:hypothetical protein n=1 Tax=Okeania sp. SIO2B3 TaxID=2607784 RepID=UPI0013C224FE|nr:hypothetical protein [Okeania sp. SIO2B3]NET43461.1 hypothetical protein [Okeania sp. SIO2B3]
MTEIDEVIIYEFRSGFTYEFCGNSWRSTGFYGSPYVGHTFNDGVIPEPLQRATRREDSRFDVSQKIDYQSFINLPHQTRDLMGFKEFNESFVHGNALVGRIIEEWAVLAVVSIAIDFANRIFPVKRYFCCRESYDRNYDAMATLIEFFFDTRPENLTFDILENKPEKSHKFDGFSSQDLESLDYPDSQDFYDSKFDGLRLFKPGLDMSKNNLLKMWKTCLSLVPGDREKAAWAFNVDSVASPTDFTLIQAGTKEFFHRNYSTVSRQPALPPSSSNQRESTNSNYSSPQASSPSQFNQGTTSNNLDTESVFKDFVEDGNLSQQTFRFITKGIQQNNQQLQNLSNKGTDEIRTEFNDYYLIIRYYTLSALIVPERAVDLFQQLLFSRNDIWEEFLKSAKYFKYFQQRQNDPYLKKTIEKSIEESVWLIINNLVENQFRLPRQKNFRLYQSGKLKRFFTKEENIWRKGIFLSYQKFLPTESSDTGQQQESTSSSFQGFLDNLDNEQYRKEYKKGYEKITQIFAQVSKNTSHHKTEFLFFQALIEQKFRGKVSHGLYSKLKKYPANASLFLYLVKEKTIWENLCQILNWNRRKIGRRSPQLPPSREPQLTNQNPVGNVPHNTQNITPPSNSGNYQQINQNPVGNVPHNTQNQTPPSNSGNYQQINRTPVDNLPHNTQNQTPPNNSGNRRQTNNAKRLLKQISTILAVFSLLGVIATMILGFLQFAIEVVISPLVLALLLILIAFLMFIVQEYML